MCTDMVTYSAHSPQHAPLQYSIACPLAIQYSILWYIQLWPCVALLPFFGGVYMPLVALCSLVFDSNQTKTRCKVIEQVNQAAESVFEQPLLMCLSPIQAWKYWRNFVVLSVIDLDEKTIGQCQWLSTKCIRSTHRLSGSSTHFCELF